MTRATWILAFPSVIAATAAFSLFGGCSGGGGGGGDRLPAPIMVAATGGDGVITLSWQPVEDAERYLVYSAREPGVTPENYDDLDGGRRRESGDEDHEEDVDNGETRFYVVTSVDGASREGTHSQEVVAAASAWGPATPIEIAAGDALAPVLAADPSGPILAAWSRHAGGRYEIRASTWSGGAWSAPAAIDSAAGMSHAPAIAVNASGDALAAWRQGTGSDDRIWAALGDTTSGWTAPLALGSGGGTSHSPAVAVDDTGNGHVVYSSLEGGAYRILAARWDATATAWDPTLRLDADTVDAGAPVVAVDLSGNGLAVWAQRGAVLSARFQGGAWNAPVMVTGTSAAAANPHLAMNEAGRAVAVWEQTTLNGVDVAAAVFTPAGGWGAPGLIDAHPLAARTPRVAIDAAGNALAVWVQDNGNYDVVGTCRYLVSGGAWQAPRMTEADDSGNAADPVARFYPDGDVMAVFTQQVVGLGGPGATENVYAQRIAVLDTTETHPVMLVSKYGLNVHPALVIGSGGAATAVWTQLGTGGQEIWFNRLP